MGKSLRFRGKPPQAVLSGGGGHCPGGDEENLSKQSSQAATGKALAGSGRLRCLFMHCYLEFKLLFGTCGELAVSPNVASEGFARRRL
jgi:hypothetical protein